MAENNDSALESLKTNWGLQKSSGHLKVQQESSALAKPNTILGRGKETEGKRTKKKRNTGKRSAAENLRRSVRRIGGSGYQIQLPGLALGVPEPVDVKVTGGTPAKAQQKARGPSMRMQGGTAKPVKATFASSAGSPVPEELGVRPIVVGGKKKNSTSTKSMSGSLVSASTGKGDALKDFGVKENIIRYGELLKKSVTLANTWKNRFLVVTSRNVFYYEAAFDVPQDFSQIDIPPKGGIPLETIENVTVDKGDPHHQKFNIYTPARVYRFQAEFNGGATVWVGVISGACANATQQFAGNRGHVGRRESFNSVVADEVDSFNLSSRRQPSVFGFRNAANKVRNEDQALKTMAYSKGSGPHMPASIDDFISWSTYDVAGWLSRKNLGKYTQLFLQNNVNGEALEKFGTKEHALNFGIEEKDVMNLLSAIEEVKENALLID